MEEEPNKGCPRCKIIKPLSRFYLEKGRKKFSCWCKECHRIHITARRNRELSAAHGRDIESAENCEICGRARGGRRLSSDHCHKTGNRRGLLCNPCNVGLGCFKDNIDLMKAAIEYIERYACELSP